MSRRRIDSIQGYRFLLFLAVFFFHCGIDMFSMGWGGVQAFLVLSSFFLTGNLINKKSINLFHELSHRIKRIYPPYICIVLGASIMVIIVKKIIPYNVFVYLLSAQNFYCSLFGHLDNSGMLGHTWYITLDIYLFILWILMFKFIPKQYIRMMSYLGIIFCILWRVSCNLLFDNSFISYTIPFGQLDSFCIGSILYFNLKDDKWSNYKYILIDILIGCIGIVSCILYASSIANIEFLDSYFYFQNSGNYTHNIILVNIYFFVAILSAGLIRLCLKKLDKSIISCPIMVKLGNWSYILYLFHFPIIVMFKHIVSNPWIVALTSLPLTIFTTYLWFRYLENRIINKLGAK